MYHAVFTQRLMLIGNLEEYLLEQGLTLMKVSNILGQTQETFGNQITVNFFFSFFLR
jgi:hypothetical protein